MLVGANFHHHLGDYNDYKSVPSEGACASVSNFGPPFLMHRAHSEARRLGGSEAQKSAVL